MLREIVGPSMSVGETDGSEKAEWLHVFFCLCLHKIFSTRKTGGGEDNGIEDQQVRNCLEKLKVFKTLDHIRFTWGHWKVGWGDAIR